MEFKDLFIGLKVKFKGQEETILGLTKNSALITLTKRSDRGINCTQWLDDIQIKKELSL